VSGVIALILRYFTELALQADYVTVAEDRPIMSAKYRLPVIFGQNLPTQQLHSLFATAKLFVRFRFTEIGRHLQPSDTFHGL